MVSAFVGAMAATGALSCWRGSAAAARYCNHLVLLDGGTVACSGPTDAVLAPEVLEPVYGIAVRRLVEPDCVQLIFQPRSSTTRNGTEETR